MDFHGQYNEDEWEECKESAFLWWWRILATLSTVVLAILFYYYVAENRRNLRRHKLKKEDESEHSSRSAKDNYSSRNGFESEHSQTTTRLRKVVLNTSSSQQPFADKHGRSSDNDTGSFEGDAWAKRSSVTTDQNQSDAWSKHSSTAGSASDAWSTSTNDLNITDDVSKQRLHPTFADDHNQTDAWSTHSSTTNTAVGLGERSEVIIENNSHLTKSPKQSTNVYEITNILTTVEVTLHRQKNSDNDNETNSSNDFGEKVVIMKTSSSDPEASQKSNDSRATSPELDSFRSDTLETIRIIAHDDGDGLSRSDGSYSIETRRTPSPGKPMFVSELNVKSNENGQNGKDESDEETTNIMLEIAKVETTEELLLKVKTLEAITEIMRQAGLESSNLIFGIDYTASNKYQGEESFDGRSLHAIGDDIINPYQHVISILGKTMAPFASSGFIAAYGFGDVKTSDTDVFSFIPDSNCSSFAEVLEVYNKITPNVILSGPTNFAPLIYQAIKICKQVKDYHILVIVADGQVTNEKATTRAIVEACKVPLSIIVVGVGDGPWEMMRIFDEKLPKRKWDNFHFVEFHKVTSKAENPDLAFAIQALVEIPDQFKKIKSLGLLNFFDDDGESNEE